MRVHVWVVVSRLAAAERCAFWTRYPLVRLSGSWLVKWQFWVAVRSMRSGV